MAYEFSNTVKIIGFGDVVKEFLRTHAENIKTYNLEIYARNIRKIRQENNCSFYPLQSYKPSPKNIVFYCCSIDEEEQIKRSHGDKLSRYTVSEQNLRIVREFRERGFFDMGLIFVLTNPSDLMAEYIAKTCPNKHVYALGSSVDKHRYQRIFDATGILNLSLKYDICGTHSDYPLVDIEYNEDIKTLLKTFDIKEPRCAEKETALLNALRDKLRSEIKMEFNGFKPPIKSGALAIANALRDLARNDAVSVSGLARDSMHFAIGYLDPELLIFKPTRPQSAVCEKLLGEIFRHHQEIFKSMVPSCEDENYEGPDCFITSE